MRSLAIIEAEHDSMRRMSSALGVLAENLARGPDEADLHTLELIVEYFDTFTERFHHPKEDDFLFARIKLRSNEAGAIIDRLHHEHEMGPGQLARLREMIGSPSLRAPGGTKALIAEIGSFCRHLDDHMHLEEQGTFALARRVLTPEDWREVDGAFEAHLDPLRDVEGGARIADLRRRITQLLPSPVGLGGHVDSAMGDEVQPLRQSGALMLEVQDLKTSYGRIEALHGVSLNVHEGEIVVLVGANGAGKTTLLRCISGVRPITAGEVRFRGHSLTRSPPETRVHAGLCQVPEGRQVFGPMSIKDNLLMGAYTRPAVELEESLDEVYRLFPILAEKRELPAGTLSGGQQQMLAVGRALMAKPKLLLLDEPSMGLAPLIVEEIFRIISQLKNRGITILLVEQNARAALAIADRGYVLETGRIVLTGSGRDLLGDEQVKKAYLGM